MNHTFSYLVTQFLTTYLLSEHNLSPNTLASYSDCIRLLIHYLCKQLNIEPESIDLPMITSERIRGFLDSLEKECHCCSATRNQRLGAIKSWFHFLVRNSPELMQQNERIQAIKLKKTDHRPPPSLTVEEISVIISEPDSQTLLGARDKALLQLMYNTGGRVQEIADLTLNDLHFDNQPSVTLTGKGRKTRVLPICQKTVDEIRHYLAMRNGNTEQSDHLFLNNRGVALTRFGIGRMLDKHVKTAILKCASLENRAITPHVFRHSIALHLIEASNDIDVVQHWLGHADIRTTSHYIEVSIERKRQALKKLPLATGIEPLPCSEWKQPGIMEFLIKCSRRSHYVVP